MIATKKVKTDPYKGKTEEKSPVFPLEIEPDFIFMLLMEEFENENSDD
ncbi:hypothetical protein HYW53_00910 [Candidatus Giovannonibacteria bacterium]|nr:hypothetical protein [Candidatus Giovannonibacteria bacterium]